jgi:hypothetical protein
MKQPKIFLAYAPRGAGLRCALAYLESGVDVYGWFAGPCEDASVARLYFVIENLHAAQPARIEMVEEAELHGAWALDEARRHELAEMQEAFSREWLFYRTAREAATQLQAYAEAELASGEVNVRFERLSRFNTQQPNWTYYSPTFEGTVLRQLSGRWPLEYRLHADDYKPRRAAGPRP